MRQELRQQAILLTEQIMRTYYCQRDIYGVLNWMAPDASWIGPGQQEKKYTLNEMKTYFELGKDSIPSCEVSSPDLRAVDLGEDYCLVTGAMTIRTIPGSQLVLEVDQRVSFTFCFNQGVFQVVHMHISNPYGDMEGDEYFPHKIGSQSYQYLQRLLRQKTEVLDMIAANISGGLKGSNDDSTFSYFYVNEGLPKMLGYSYDEFMKKTGGNAVGAVYPLDLDAALADCARCFSEGPDYSTEYRMEKKDGSLIWVLDSGCKVVDGEGITRINSIITDVTPLKQALFELEIERERYRIALHHITGAMCEYDVAGDFFTLYRQTDCEGEGAVGQMEIPCFSKAICSGLYADVEEGAVFLAMCTGQCKGSLEFHTRLLGLDNLWHWAQFSCSVIYDHSGKPVRAIGMLKDITQEKQRNQELLNQARRDGLTGLLNQTASKEAIQDCLSQAGDRPAKEIALFVIDLDCFKEVNDINGHLYGNEVLIKTARILEEAADKDCIIGRIGGDEFIILQRDAKPEKVSHVAVEIVRRVKEIGLDKAVAVSCSVGIAYREHQEEAYTQLFERADRALYCAKDKGRDGFFIDL